GVAAAAGNVARFRAHLQSGAPRAPPAGEQLALAHVERALDELRKLKGGEEAGEGLTLASLRIEMDALKERHSLLGVPFAENPEMQLCVQELSLLSQAWEMAQRVLSHFAAWEAQPWGSADVADLLEATRAAHKEVRSLPSGARSLGVSRQLEEAVKARLAALPVVAELRHPAFSQEHWSRLFAAIGRPDRAVGPELTLGALLALELAQHADACLDAVGQAQKEAATQAGLGKIEDAWRDWTLAFSRVAGQGSDVPLLQPDPLLAEALESDQVVLQGMASSAHVARNPRVLEVVVGWQARLGSVDAVLAAWRDVQQRWQALESIFTGSADIRQRLPEDTARFESTHVEFVALQEESLARPGVLDACLQPGMAPRLDSLLRSLELCSKSLQAYLETKRLAFPRFYFVSPAELLDILAKGHDPRAIARYLPKIFESMSCLEFAQPKGEEESAETVESSRGAADDESLAAASSSSARLRAAPKSSSLSSARPARSRAPSESVRASFRASLKLSARGPSPLPPAAPAVHETLYAVAMLSPDGERIAFDPPCPCG
ncbi:N-terminal region 2 of dynein heavy chain, partial [Helicosporidium sp. ATCC 50920]